MHCLTSCPTRAPEGRPVPNACRPAELAKRISDALEEDRLRPLIAATEDRNAAALQRLMIRRPLVGNTGRALFCRGGRTPTPCSPDTLLRLAGTIQHAPRCMAASSWPMQKSSRHGSQAAAPGIDRLDGRHPGPCRAACCSTTSGSTGARHPLQKDCDDSRSPPRRCDGRGVPPCQTPAVNAPPKACGNGTGPARSVCPMTWSRVPRRR